MLPLVLPTRAPVAAAAGVHSGVHLLSPPPLLLLAGARRGWGPSTGPARRAAAARGSRPLSRQAKAGFLPLLSPAPLLVPAVLLLRTGKRTLHCRRLPSAGQR